MSFQKASKIIFDSYIQWIVFNKTAGNPTRLAVHSYFGCPTTIVMSVLYSKVVEIDIVVVVVVVVVVVYLRLLDMR